MRAGTPPGNKTSSRPQRRPGKTATFHLAAKRSGDSPQGEPSFVSCCLGCRRPSQGERRRFPVFCACGEQPMSSNWFYSSNGQQHGPISAAQLKQLADSGHLMPDDFVCQEGSEQWVVASKVKGLFAAPQTAQPISNEPVEALPQIQINVGKAIKGVGNTVQGVVQSEPVQSAAAAVQNAAGQAAEGVGNFIRSDAVQSQVGAANDFWSSLTTQNKLLIAGVGGLGLLMMSCCMCGMLGMMFGGGGTDKPSNSKPSSTRTATSSSPDNPVKRQDEIDPLESGYQRGYAEGCRVGERFVRQIEDQRGQAAKENVIRAANISLSQVEAQKQGQLDALKRGARNSESIQRAIGYADGLRETLANAGYLQ